MTVQPEKQKEMLQTLQSMLGPHAHDPGCLSARAYCDIECPDVFSLMIEWKTKNALQHYMMSDRFRVLLGAKCLLAEPMTLDILTVSRAEGPEVMDSLRNKPIYKGGV